MKHDVLILDADRDLLEVLNLMFSDEFNLTLTSSGKEGLECLSQVDYHFVILDIQLPDLSGFEICQHIENLDPATRPHVIVLSSETEVQTVKKAYQMGISDYISKPFNVVAFHERILRFSHDVDNIRLHFKGDVQDVDLAATAMKQAAYYGSGLEMLSRLNRCPDEPALMKEVATSLQNLDLNVVIQLRCPNSVQQLDVDESRCSEIDVQVFSLLKDQGRIYQFGKRCMFNDEHVSILVKNMPEQGSVSYDAVIDLLAKLVPAINARFISLLEHQSLLKAKENVASAVALLGANLKSVEAEQKQSMDNIAMKIGMSFHQLEMSEDQERYFISLIEEEIKKDVENPQLVELQNLMEQVLESLSSVEEQAPVEDDSLDGDIELF